MAISDQSESGDKDIKHTFRTVPQVQILPISRFNMILERGAAKMFPTEIGDLVTVEGREFSTNFTCGKNKEVVTKSYV